VWVVRVEGAVSIKFHFVGARNLRAMTREHVEKVVYSVFLIATLVYPQAAFFFMAASCEMRRCLMRGAAVDAITRLLMPATGLQVAYGHKLLGKRLCVDSGMKLIEVG
jgi:hypothetical protein